VFHGSQFELETLPLQIVFIEGHGTIAGVADDNALHLDVLVTRVEQARDVVGRGNRHGLAVPGHPRHENRRQQRHETKARSLEEQKCGKQCGRRDTQDHRWQTPQGSNPDSRSIRDCESRKRALHIHSTE
jgi:hypothetical protein